MYECVCCGAPTMGFLCDGCPADGGECDCSVAWHCEIGQCDGSDCQCQE